MMSINLIDSAILNIRDCYCIIKGIRINKDLITYKNGLISYKVWWYLIKKNKNLLWNIKMGKEVITFGGIETK